MRTSEHIGELAAALAAAQAEYETAKRDSDNPYFKSKYADLASVFDACRPALTKHGIAIVQAPTLTESGRVKVVTRLMHASGQWCEEELEARPKDDGPQAVGSVISYLRRYGAQAMTGVVSDDDDGEAGQGRGTPPRPTQARGPVITRPAEDIGRPEAREPVAQETLDTEVAQAFPPDVADELPDARVLFEQGIRECPACHQPTLRKGAKQWGGGVYCNKKDGGCGMKWREGATLEVKPAPVESDGSPIAQEERGALLLKATELADVLGFTKNQRLEHWATYCGSASPETADPAALRDLVAWLQTRADAKRGAA